MKKFFSSFPEAFQIMDDHHLNPTVCIHNDLGLYAQGSQSGSRSQATEAAVGTVAAGTDSESQLQRGKKSRRRGKRGGKKNRKQPKETQAKEKTVQRDIARRIQG